MNAARCALLAGALVPFGFGAHAQAPADPDQPRVAAFVPPVMDNMIFTHVLLDQLEGRVGGSNPSFKWDGQGWSGTDYNKIWVKTEGQVSGNGRVEDGIQQFLYDRAISTYFDLQAGVRLDLDSGPTRTWAALGVQGLAVYFFDLEATVYAGDQGRFAGRLVASYDLLLTNRLILQPEVEMNFYSKSDPARVVGSGLSDIDAGLRLRYEFSRKFAPYIGVAYQGKFGQTATFARNEGESPNAVLFTFGVRAWY